MKKIAAVLGLLVCSSAFSTPNQISLWKDITEDQRLSSRNIDLNISAIKKRSLSLRLDGLKELLMDSNDRQSLRPVDSEVSPLEIDLPLPNGGFEHVRVFDSPILSPDIAEHYPDIKTWRVVGVDNPAIRGRIDFTSKGFHGMLVMADGDIVYIDPDEDDSTNIYHSLSKHENLSHFKSDFNCEVHDDHPVHKDSEDHKYSARVLAGLAVPELITYRLALAGTAEYTESQGGSKADAYASMVTTINRVNEIYRRDLGINLQLVSGETLLYENADTDPYTNNKASSLVPENIANINQRFGVDNYDIGHVFAKGSSGGLAYAGAVCQADYKAGGATGTHNPQGEIFDIEYVAHEMGHQLGATHTFNSEEKSCGGSSRIQKTAVEPGSGSTIMGYAGLCANDNLQSGSDAVFHWMSIDQINYYTRSKTGASCGVRKSSAVENLVANAGNDIKIPANTPFLLNGSAIKGSTYSWDQIDTGAASLVDKDLGDNAIIRSLYPATIPDRYIPNLDDLFASKNTIGENLPKTTRNLNFAHVVRGNNGGISTDFKKVSVTNTGSIFKVLSQSSSETLSTGEIVKVTWEVAGSNVEPINCQSVNIKLLRSDGVTNILAMNTKNDGIEQVSIPYTTPVMTNARIMVGCVDDSFFNISSGKITINFKEPSDPLAPVIVIQGSESINIKKGDKYTDLGATAIDSNGISVEVDVVGEVDTTVLGEYTIVYTATDNSGKTAIAQRNIYVSENGEKLQTEAGGAFDYLFFVLFILLYVLGLLKKELSDESIIIIKFNN